MRVGMKISPPPTPKRPPRIPVANPANRNIMRRDCCGRSAADQRVSANITNTRLRTKVWLELDDRFVIGEGGLDLLTFIKAAGSLAAAARRLGWSYRHAW